MPVGGAAPGSFAPGGIKPRAATDFNSEYMGDYILGGLWGGYDDDSTVFDGRSTAYQRSLIKVTVT